MIQKRYHSLNIYVVVALLTMITIAPTTNTIPLYAITDKVGSFADYFIARGDINPEDQQLFKEITKKWALITAT